MHSENFHCKIKCGCITRDNVVMWKCT